MSPRTRYHLGPFVFILGFRAEFEEEGLKSSRERLSQLDNILQVDQANLEKHEAQKAQIQREIIGLEEQLDNLKEQVAGHQAVLDEKTKTVEQVKKTTMKAAKVLDQALKDISSCVCCMNLTVEVEATADGDTERRD